MNDVTTGPLHGRQDVTCSIAAHWRVVVGEEQLCGRPGSKMNILGKKKK
jgi:hypothetical protein